MQFIDLRAKAVGRYLDPNLFGVFPGKDQGRDDHSNHHGNGKVGCYRNPRDEDYHKGVCPWNLAHNPKAGPLKGADHHHKHHPS